MYLVDGEIIELNDGFSIAMQVWLPDRKYWHRSYFSQVS